MMSRYVSYVPPRNVGMTMVRGPAFFDVFGAGWRFTAADDGGTVAVWRYNFTCRPKLVRPLAHAIGRWFLQRDIERRIEGFARACRTPEIVAAAISAR